MGKDEAMKKESTSKNGRRKEMSKDDGLNETQFPRMVGRRMA